MQIKVMINDSDRWNKNPPFQPENFFRDQMKSSPSFLKEFT
jgi:hypothetical protein